MMNTLYVPPGALVIIQVEYGLSGSKAIVDLQTYIRATLQAEPIVFQTAMEGVRIDVLQPDHSNGGLNFGMIGQSAAPTPPPTSSPAAGTVLGGRP